MQTAFFIEDEFDGRVASSSVYDVDPNTNNSVHNVSDPRPRVAWIAGKADPSAAETRFVVDNNNRYIPATAWPVGTTDLTLTRGTYTGTQLANEITAQFAASTYMPTWIASYDVSTGIFTLLDAAISPTNDAKILWATGNNAAKSMAKELGFVNPGGSAADTTTAAIVIKAEFPRWNTHSSVKFKMPSAKNLRAWLCEVGNAELGEVDSTIDVSSIRIYGAASDLGNLFNWQTSAPIDLTYSPGPSFSENQIRLALYSSGSASTQTHWMFTWRHQDSHKTHNVKLCKAFERTWSDTGRTLTTLKKQGLLNTGQSLGIDNYYPVPRLQRWVAPLAFDAWPASEYRDVVQEVVHHGRQNGLLWALRWDDIASGEVDAEDEADKGFLLWATLQDYSRDTYVGESADFISGELDLEQLR